MTGVEVGFVIDCGIDGTGVVHRSSFESGELIESGGEGAGAAHKSSSTESSG